MPYTLDKLLHYDSYNLQKANGEVVSAVLALHYNFELLHCHFEKATIKPSVDYEVVLRFVSPAGETLDQAVDYGVFSSQCQECAEGVNTLKVGIAMKLKLTEFDFLNKFGQKKPLEGQKNDQFWVFKFI